MKSSRALFLASFLSTAAGLALTSGCTPMHPSNHPGSPPAANETRPGLIEKALRSKLARGNTAPKKYGIPYLLDYARHQAGEVGPNAELRINENQLRFGETAGRNQGLPAVRPKRNGF